MYSVKIFSNACDIEFRGFKVFVPNVHHIKLFISLFISAVDTSVHVLDTSLGRMGHKDHFLTLLNIFALVIVVSR